MTQVFVIVICVAAVITAFFSVLWGWIILGVPSLCILAVLFSVKQNRWKNIPELSATANQMLQKYGHNYSMPFAGRDFSASASTLFVAAVPIAIIGAFKGFWWGIGIAVAFCLTMGAVSRAFNPTHFIANPIEQLLATRFWPIFWKNKGPRIAIPEDFK